jgi:hypothetical protein
VTQTLPKASPGSEDLQSEHHSTISVKYSEMAERCSDWLVWGPFQGHNWKNNRLQALDFEIWAEFLLWTEVVCTNEPLLTPLGWQIGYRKIYTHLDVTSSTEISSNITSLEFTRQLYNFQYIKWSETQTFFFSFHGCDWEESHWGRMVRWCTLHKAVLHGHYPADTLYWNNVKSTLNLGLHVGSRSIQRSFNIVCLLGRDDILNAITDITNINCRFTHKKY